VNVVHEVDGVKTLLGLQDGDLISGSEQDCTPYAERAQALQAIGNHGKEFRLAAIIPNVIIETYMNVNGIDYREVMGNPVHFKRMLADPDLSSFRVWEGRV
jgi:hypothetical protein